MSNDIHFAADVSVSDTTSVGRLRAALKALMRATRSCSALSRLAPSATWGVNKPSRPTTASTVARRPAENRIITPLAAAHPCRGLPPGSRVTVSGEGADADLIRQARLPAFYELAAAHGGLDFGGESRRDARVDPYPSLLVVDALEGAAGADLLDESAGVIWQRGLHVLPARGRRLREPSAQRLEAVAFQRRREHRGGKLRPERLAERVAFLAAEPVGLIQNEEARPPREVERLQRLVDDAHVLVQVGMRHVGNVHEKVGVGELLERRAERGDERRWQLVHEADRVREQDRCAARQRGAPRCRVERRERLISDEHVRAGESVHERRLPRVGVSDDRREEEPFGRARAACALALPGNLVELLAQILDAFADDLPVALELRLTRTARADPAAEAGHFLPAAGESRQPVLELRELDLDPSLSRP